VATRRAMWVPPAYIPQLFALLASGPITPRILWTLAAEDVLLPYRYQVVQKRWEKLHDAAAHRRLRDAITAQVVQNSIAARNPVGV
jgi:hypothetical protein